MTLSWYLSHPAETGLVVLTAVAVAAAIDYWLSLRYNWHLDAKESIIGYGVGVLYAGIGIPVLGVERSMILATVSIAAVGALLYHFKGVPENGGEPNGA